MKPIEIKFINHLEYCHQVILFLNVGVALSFKFSL